MQKGKMRKKNLVLWSIIMIGVLLGQPYEVLASSWLGLTPSSYGGRWGWGGPVILEQGNSTVYEYTFTGSFGASDACQWAPNISLDYGAAANQVFFSLDPTTLVTEMTEDIQYLEAGQTAYYSFTVYLSNPQLEPTQPDEYYNLYVCWKPYVDYGTGVGIRGQIDGVIGMQVTPEPTMLGILALGGLLLRKAHWRRT